MFEAHERAVAKALHVLVREVRWKPGKDSAHLAKRKAMGHLPVEATISHYNGLILRLVSEPRHRVYHYPFGTSDYYAVSGEVESVSWLAIFAGDGTMETAFPPDDLAEYVAKRGFRLMGTVGEIDDE